MLKMEGYEQPLIKLSELQFSVYEVVKQLQPVNIETLRNSLKEVKKSSLTSALRSLKEKGLILHEIPFYKTTDKKFFNLKNKEPANEPKMDCYSIQEQLEWNKRILQQKALREARMRINL